MLNIFRDVIWWYLYGYYLLSRDLDIIVVGWSLGRRLSVQFVYEQWEDEAGRAERLLDKDSVLSAALIAIITSAVHLSRASPFIFTSKLLSYYETKPSFDGVRYVHRLVLGLPSDFIPQIVTSLRLEINFNATRVISKYVQDIVLLTQDEERITDKETMKIYHNYSPISIMSTFVIIFEKVIVTIGPTWC